MDSAKSTRALITIPAHERPAQSAMGALDSPRSVPLQRIQRRSGREVGPNCASSHPATLTERDVSVTRNVLRRRAPMRTPQRRRLSARLRAQRVGSPFRWPPRARLVCGPLRAVCGHSGGVPAGCRRLLRSVFFARVKDSSAGRPWSYQRRGVPPLVSTRISHRRAARGLSPQRNHYALVSQGLSHERARERLPPARPGMPALSGASRTLVRLDVEPDGNRKADTCTVQLQFVAVRGLPPARSGGDVRSIQAGG